MYDILYVSLTGNTDDFDRVKSRYPRTQFVKDVKTFNDLKKKSFTKMFWVIWDDVILDLNFNLDSYKADKWDDMYVHVFKNGEYYDGICLFPKSLEVSNREWDCRYFLNKKEIDIVASQPFTYNQYILENFDQYNDALNNSSTELFWCIWPGIVVTDKSIFKMYFSHHNVYDRNENHVFKNSCNGEVSYTGGLVLFSKSKPISKREFDNRFLVNKKEHNILASKSQYPKYTFESYSDYLEVIEKETQPLFWGVWSNVEIVNEGIFDLYFDPFNGKYDFDRNTNHVFKNGCDKKESYLNGIVLFSKNNRISEAEFKRKFLVDKKEHDILVSRSRYPRYNIDSYEEYESILEKETQPLFWGLWNNVEIINQEIFDFYFDPNDGKYDFDRNMNHVFKNGCGEKESYLNGIVLFSRNNKVSRAEFKRKFLVDKKEHDILVSRSRYPRYNIDSYEEYESILEKETQPLFWGVWSNVEIINQEIFDFYFDPNDGKYDFDRNTNHVFKNGCDKKESYLNGIVLFSKNNRISEAEFKRKFLVDKKEHDILVSRSRYPRYNIDTYEEYESILEKETNPLFWGVWNNIEIINDSIFDFYFDPNDGKYDFDRNTNHVFKNGCGEKESYLNGLILFSKNNKISKSEFKRKFLVDKKEHDILASRFRYPRYNIDTYEEYESILEKEQQPLFWCIWPEIEITDNSVFDFYFDPNDGKYDFDRGINHVFQHKFKESELTYNGLMLMSKNKIVGSREIDFRFLINKKEHEQVVSSHRPYDIVFISYNEPNADKNYQQLLHRFPTAKRVHGVKGIHQAHIEAAKIASTHMFWVVDGDAEILDSFNFDYPVSRYEREIVHVWRSQNPINNLIYGYGGVKLLPRHLTLSMDVNTTDMTTSISKLFKPVNIVSNITSFNTDPFNTWKSAFRECCKLSSKIIERQDNEETIQRLDTWCTVGAEKTYGKYAIEGAIAGRNYGTENKNNSDKLRKINDFEWLKQYFEETYER